MALTAITGKLGTGKSKAAVFMIRKYLREGRKVATNLDIDIGKLMPKTCKGTIVRLPDKPTAFDLDALPHGNPDSYDEDKNGALVLDELGTWLNTRAFQDKERMPVIDWMLHSRKHGWDCFLIMQGVGQIDKQVRDNILEYVARCTRFDKVKIPFVGGLLNGMFGGRVGFLPKFHMMTTRLGTAPDGMVADRMHYLGTELHAAYDTRQIFKSNYPHGAHSLLSSWHLHRMNPQPEKRSAWATLVAWFRSDGRTRSGRPAGPKLAIVSRLMDLPADERIRHVQRLERLGLLDAMRIARLESVPVALPAS